jgi:hypothetical protein
VSYTVGAIQVFVNGILLNTDDYTATNGTSVVLASAASVGDVVEFIAISIGIISVGASGAQGPTGPTGPTGIAAYTRTEFSATGGQTTFIVSYTVGAIQVYVNGVLLNSADYTATNGTSVVLASACLVGDTVEFIAISVGSISVGATGPSGGPQGPTGPTGFTGPPGTASYVRTAFNATAGQTTFSVTYTPGAIEVFVNGVLLNSVDYTATNGTSVVLATPCAAGYIVEFIAISVGSVAVGNLIQIGSTVISGGASGRILYDNAGLLDEIPAGTSTNVLTSSGTGVYWSAKSTMNYRTITSSTTVLATDDLLMTNGTLTVTLPAASTVAGQQFYIKNINTANGVVTVLPNGSELIDGYTSATIGYYNTMFGVISIGTGWVIF